MGLPRQWSKSLLNGATSGLDDGCTSTIGARVQLVHEYDWCTSISGAREVHEYEWCTRGAREVHEHEWCTRGARV